MQPMQLFHAPTSPYVRKVMVCAIELGLDHLITPLPSAAHPVVRDERIAAFNPLAKIPAARLADGRELFDSRVICEYLDAAAAGGLFPEDERRWAVLTQQAAADGLLDAALLARYEITARPEGMRSDAWRAAQMVKIVAALDWMDGHLEEIGGPLTIGGIATGCALGYLDFRFAGEDWRTRRPGLAAWFAEISKRPSFAATVPRDG